jgi:ring-1,2-phenylacetyl-CoA epoxidase subunit PaaD
MASREASSGISAASSGKGRAASPSTGPTANCPPPGGSLLARATVALDTVGDPELPFLTIRDIGILRDVRLDGETVEVVITPTYSGCPAMDVIAIEIAAALAKAGIGDHRITRVLSPAWTTDWLTPEARDKLAANGIAPPARAAGKRALFAADEVRCPRCGSDATEQVSAFGSTACKAHYRCTACHEPFEYFKCL